MLDLGHSNLLIFVVGSSLVRINSNINKADRPANSRERWAGALMEVRSLLSLNSASCDGWRSAVGAWRTDKAVYRVACSRLKTR